MKKTIKQKIKELIDSGIPLKDILLKLNGVKEKTIKWYYYKLKLNQNEFKK